MLGICVTGPLYGTGNLLLSIGGFAISSAISPTKLDSLRIALSCLASTPSDLEIDPSLGIVPAL